MRILANIFQRIILIAPLLLMAGCASSSVSEPILNPQSLDAQTHCKLIYLYDGDTIGCDFNGNGRVDGHQERIRLLGIDAPEMHYSRKNHSGKDQPYAVAAMDYVRQHGMGKPLTLVYDERMFDRYNRRLAYVYVGASATGTSLNQQLLERGLARLMFIPPNQLGLATMQQAESEAQSQHLGLWKN